MLGGSPQGLGVLGASGQFVTGKKGSQFCKGVFVFGLGLDVVPPSFAAIGTVFCRCWGFGSHQVSIWRVEVKTDEIKTRTTGTTVAGVEAYVVVADLGDPAMIRPVAADVMETSRISR